MLISGSQTPGRAHRDNITQSALNRHARNDRLREHTLIPTRCQAGRLSQPSIATRCCTHWTTLPTVHPHPVPAHALLSPLLQPDVTHTGPLRDRPLSFFSGDDGFCKYRQRYGLVHSTCSMRHLVRVRFFINAAGMVYYYPFIS